MRLNKNIKIFLNYILGPLLFAWLSYSIFKQIKNQPHLEEAWLRIRSSFSNITVINLILVFPLMFANWSLEALKWKLSVQHVQPVSFARAVKAILSGVSFSVTTPNRTGSGAARHPARPAFHSTAPDTHSHTPEPSPDGNTRVRARTE